VRRHAKASALGSTRHRGNRRGAVHFAVSSCVALALLAAFAPALASAGLVRVPQAFSPITGAGSGLTIGTPGGIAVDEGSTNLFLNDATTKTDILGAEGGAPAGLVSPFTITGLSFTSVNNAVAVDNSATSPNKGTVYVVSGSAPPKIKKFQRNPVTEKYAAAGEFADPAPAATNQAGAAVDIHGNLFVGDFGSQSVVKFNVAGTAEKQYNLVASGVRPNLVAVDAAGNLFAARAAVGASFGAVFKYPADAFGEIDPLNFVEVAPSGATGIAVDPSRNALFVAFKDRVVEYDTTTLAKRLEFGLGVLGTTTRLAVNSATDRVYVADNGTGKKNVAVFGPTVVLPTVAATTATGVTGTKASLSGTVNPEGVAVTDCFFEYGTTTAYGQTASCEGAIPTDSSNHLVSANVSSLLPDGVTYHYRLVATNGNGTERSADQTLVTAATVVTEAATGVGTTTATLHGTVHPESSQYAQCKFEYGLTTSASFEHEAPCNPPAGSIPSDFAPHAVSASITELQPNAAYRFRLTATNSTGTVSGEALTFGATGPPQITEVRAQNADQNSATIEAKVDPRGFQTNYFFEWGPTTAYGNRVPAGLTEPSAGAGEQPVPVTAGLSGLAMGTTYHYRVIAKSNAGTTVSRDYELETLNACGLPERRCLELVSPRDPGPVAIPGRESTEEIDFQATPTPGSLAYVIASGGLPDATRGSQVLYRARRDAAASSWISSQLSPSILVRSETSSGNSNSAKTLGLSADLSCGVVESNQPLTNDATTRRVVEIGGANLYRLNPDGSYTAITNLPPENQKPVNGIVGNEYELVGFSGDCSNIGFKTNYQYPGLPVVGSEFLYEWDDGTLRSVGFVPAEPSGETAVEAIPGGKSNIRQNYSEVVSADGSRVFFSAKRLKSPNLGEKGRTAVFVRENGTTTRDLSLSQTATANRGAAYQSASEDGTRLFFTANYGLTSATSGGPTTDDCSVFQANMPDKNTHCDLYEYNLETNQLTDLSVDDIDPEGAEVVGFIGASSDGSHVYFAARGQLVPGKGPTSAENKAAATVSVYGAIDGQIEYVGQAAFTDLLNGLTVDRQTRVRTARVSADGRYLLFQSSANVTGYVSGGVPEAYLYDAAAASEPTVCVSCRQDGKPSVTPVANGPLATAAQTSANPLHQTARLVIRNGKPLVFFISFDRLAAGATEGVTNLYEWTHNQVFHVTTEPPGISAGGAEFKKQNIGFADASADGTDLYFITPSSLTWEDSDGRTSVYDARIGGGFPQPPGPPAPCSATVEGSCQAPSAPAPSVPSGGSATFNGPGNPTQRKGKHKKRGHKKKHKKKGQKKRNKKQSRPTNGHRRAGK
jgi:hypothetical protein